MRPAVLLALLGCAGAGAGSGCGGDGAPAAPDAGRHFDSDSGCDPGEDPGADLADELFDYAWTCAGEVAPTGTPAAAEPPVEDCSADVWPDLDPLVAACPTVSDVTRLDPVSGLTLPPSGDPRALPVEIPVSESGSYRPPGGPTSWPATLKVVEWNMEYSANLDAQIVTLTTHPDLADADVYLLSEVDRCSTRNGTRRAARLLAQAIQGDYVYGIEFVELSIGRTIGGDTGQAIVSRRPLTGASLLCHSRQKDWFADDGEPRLGQRVTLAADVPVGAATARVHTVHFESSDVLGEKRVVQVRETLDAAQADACDRPLVIAGDFNTWYCTAPELEVLRRSGFRDALLGLGMAIPTHDNGLRLDYVWTRGFRVTGGGVATEVTTSDHRPIWTTLVLE